MTDTLFQFQTDLIDTKVNMAASNAIDKVVEEIRDLRLEMKNEFHSMNTRLVAVETKLGLVNERQKEVREKFLDYALKAGWMTFGAMGYYLILHLH